MHLLLREERLYQTASRLLVGWNNHVVVEEPASTQRGRIGIELPVELGLSPPSAVVPERRPGMATPNLVLVEGGDEPARGLAVADGFRADFPSSSARLSRETRLTVMPGLGVRPIR